MRATARFLIGWWSVAIVTAAPAAPAQPPVPKLAVARHAASSRHTPSSHGRAAGAHARAARADSITAGRAGSHEGARTLQDIHIEGEIPVPQVLFITARDQRRFLDLQHRRYLKTSQQVGEQTVVPTWIGVTGSAPTESRKENPR